MFQAALEIPLFAKIGERDIRQVRSVLRVGTVVSHRERKLVGQTTGDADSVQLDQAGVVIAPRTEQDTLAVPCPADDLIGAWVNILPDEAAASRMAALKREIDNTFFAWYGPTTNGSAAYFRIQGPTLLIEYAPQGGTSHIHTIIRDPSNDYAKQLTKS